MNYLVEGSGQKYVNTLHLNIKLIATSCFQAGFPEKGIEINLEALKLYGDPVKYADFTNDHTTIMPGNYKQDIDYYRKRYQTDSLYAYVLRGLYYAVTFAGRYSESLTYYNKYLAAEKDNELEEDIPIDPHLGFVFLRNGNRKQAEIPRPAHRELVMKSLFR